MRHPLFEIVNTTGTTIMAEIRIKTKSSETKKSAKNYSIDTYKDLSQRWGLCVESLEKN